MISRIDNVERNGTLYSIHWTDNRGKRGTTVGSVASPHVSALLTRAKREGVYPTRRDPRRAAKGRSRDRDHQKKQKPRGQFDRKPSGAFDVYLRGKKIDTVFFTSEHTIDEVRRSLVGHDGYDSGIVVKRRRERKPFSS